MEDESVNNNVVRNYELILRASLVGAQIYHCCNAVQSPTYEVLILQILTEFTIVLCLHSTITHTIDQLTF